MSLDPPDLGGAAYHCQQAAEKLLKGFLVQAGIDFRRTHDLSLLGDIVLFHFPFVEALVRTVEVWTVGGVAYRYLVDNGSEPAPDLDMLVKALAIIGELGHMLRALAPSKDGDDEA